MCGRFSFFTIEILKGIITLIEEEIPENLHDNIPPYTNICTIYNNQDNLPALRNMYWQLIPSFSKEFVSEYSMYNTRVETLFEKKYKKELITTRRCLIPVNCYYEWRKEGNKKVPYSFSLKEKEIFFLGGIYSIWKNPHNLIKKYSCSVITTKANSYVKGVHDRMPLIIKENMVERWLDKVLLDAKEIKKMLFCYDDNDLIFNQCCI